MRVDGREVTVSGSLLLPLTRRTTDIVRLTGATAFLALIITSSLITRSDWIGLERSISRIVGVLTPTQSNLVYLCYGIAIIALPFVILIGLVVGRQWKLLGAYAAAGFVAVLALSITGEGIAAPRWHFDLSQRLSTNLSQFLDDPRWIAMLAAVLTVSGPWLPARWRRWRPTTPAGRVRPAAPRSACREPARGGSARAPRPPAGPPGRGCPPAAPPARRRTTRPQVPAGCGPAPPR